MSFIDPGGLFSTLKRIQNEEDQPTSGDINSKSNIPQISNALFGANVDEFATSDSSASACLKNADQLFGSETDSLQLEKNYPGGLVAACNYSTDSTLPYDVSILGIPEDGYRSRMETQVRLILRVVPRAGLPYVRWLKLPVHQLLSRPSVENSIDPFEFDTLFLKARVVRSDFGEAVYACHSCILRERRRCVRKRMKVFPSTMDAPLHKLMPNNESVEQEAELDRERIVVFANPNEYLELLGGEVMMPVRITCYCRHHETESFRVKVELYDTTHALVGVGYSSKIIITDDHKRPPKQRTEPIVPILIPPPIIEHFKNPVVTKVVPSEGPMHGGIEITIIGEKLTPESKIYFGPLSVAVMNFISSTTIVVRLPPSLVAGPVPVTCDGQLTSNEPQDFAIFNYKNDLDRSMMELALQLIGMKLTGRVDDAREIAVRIISEFSPTSNGGYSGSYSGLQSLSGGNPTERLERVLITCLAAAEVSGGIQFTVDDFMRFRTCGGQTLLHLASLSRSDHLFEYLCSMRNGLLLTAIDNNGFNPSDLYYFAGRQDFLETLGLDDMSINDSCDNLDLSTRYRLVQQRVAQRLAGRPSTLWTMIADFVLGIKHRPNRIRTHMHRLRNILWRKINSEVGIKEYYLVNFGLEANLVSDTKKKLYRQYKEILPLRKRARDLVLFYFWVPILVAAILIWYFDWGITSTVSSWSSTTENVFNSTASAALTA